MEEEALEEAADEDEADDLDNLEPPLLDMSWAQDQDKLQDIGNMNNFPHSHSLQIYIHSYIQYIYQLYT